MSKSFYESIRHTFTADERREMNDALVREVQGVYTLRNEKKAAVANFGALIESAQNRVADLAGKLSSGGEMRPTECTYQYDTPRPGLKTVVTVDTREEIRTEQMTAEERQGSFGFGPAQ